MIVYLSLMLQYIHTYTIEIMICNRLMKYGNNIIIIFNNQRSFEYYDIFYE